MPGQAGADRGGDAGGVLATVAVIRCSRFLPSRGVVQDEASSSAVEPLTLFTVTPAGEVAVKLMLPGGHRAALAGARWPVQDARVAPVVAPPTRRAPTTAARSGILDVHESVLGPDSGLADGEGGRRQRWPALSWSTAPPVPAGQRVGHRGGQRRGAERRPRTRTSLRARARSSVAPAAAGDDRRRCGSGWRRCRSRRLDVGRWCPRGSCRVAVDGEGLGVGDDCRRGPSCRWRSSRWPRRCWRRRRRRRVVSMLSSPDWTPFSARFSLSLHSA